MKRTLLCFSLLFSILFPLAAETMIVGTVYDATTGLPLVSANVFFQGTTDGCATSEEGVFCVRSNKDKRTLTLVISAIGYKSRKYKVEQGMMGAIECYLEEDNTLLADILVFPGRNPALDLMQEVRKRKTENDITLQTATQFNAHEQQYLNISNIESKHLRRLLWQKLQTGMVQQDTTYSLPLYSSLTPYRVQGRAWQPTAQPQTRAVLLTETDYQSLLSILPHHINFYDNFIPLAGHNFVSPLASNSNRYYDFYLADSLTAPTKQYLIHFKTKNPYTPSFNGELLIDSATYALQQVKATVPAEVNVNYLRQLHFTAAYDSLHHPLQQTANLIFDFAIKADSSHLFPTVMIEKEIQYQTSAANIQHSTFNIQHSAAMDSLNQLPLVKFVHFAANIIHTGYIPTGTAIDIGNVLDLFQVNQHEGIHVGLPFRTNAKLWKHISLGAYVGYGFKDRAYKGMGQIQFQLPTERRNLISVKYWDRYVWQEGNPMLTAAMENTIGYGYFGFTQAILTAMQRKKILDTATRKREFTIWTENDLTNHLETRFQFSTGRMGYGDPIVGYHNIPSYRFTSLSALFRLGWGERKLDGYFQRIHIHSNLPILRLYAEVGSYQYDDMQQANLYAQLAVSVQQRVNLGICGRLDYLYQMGITIGKVPHNMLSIIPQNETAAFDPYRFSLLPAWTTADKYLLLHTEWNMQGLLFNRIPGIRTLHLRELLTCKFAWGGLNTSSLITNHYPLTTISTPYLELGIGIGNLLRVADLYFLYRPIPTTLPTPVWAVKFRFDLGL